MITILNRRERRAKKEHFCTTCHGKIAPGEGYIYTVFSDGGHVYDSRQHIHCEVLCERYCTAVGCDEYDDLDVEWWAQDEVCAQCNQKDDGCEHTALTCPVVLEALLPPYLTSNEDVRRHLDGDDEREQ